MRPEREVLPAAGACRGASAQARRAHVVDGQRLREPESQVEVDARVLPCQPDVHALALPQTNRVDVVLVVPVVDRRLHAQVSADELVRVPSRIVVRLVVVASTEPAAELGDCSGDVERSPPGKRVAPFGTGEAPALRIEVACASLEERRHLLRLERRTQAQEHRCGCAHLRS